MGTKTCKHCQITKSTDDFYRDKSRADGFARICKECNKRDGKKRYDENAEERRAASRAWTAANRDRRSEYDRLKYIEQREIYRERHDRYAKANPERLAAIKKAWQERDREHYNELKRKNESARRARRVLSSADVIDVDLIQAKVDYYGGKCWICKSRPYEELDHVKPISKGGAHILSNLRPTCMPCNRSKSNKWPFTPALIAA